MIRMAQPMVAKRTLAIAVFVVVAALAPGMARPADTTPPARLVAVVRTYDGEARTIDVFTGVGYSVRVTRLQLADDCKIVVPWAAAHLSSFVPGTFARIDYVPATAGARTSVQGTVVAIEAIDVERTDGAP